MQSIKSVILGLLYSAALSASPALVSHIAFGAASNFSTTSSAINTTGASLLLVVINQYDIDPNTVSVSDSKSNTWLHVTSRTQAAGENNSTIFYAWQSLVVGSGHTVTISSQNFAGVVFSAFSGTQTTSTPLDQQNGSAINAAVSPQVFGSITPSVSGTLVISMLGVGGASTLPYASTAVTLIDSIVTSAGNYEGVAAGYIVQTSAVSVNPPWSWGNPTTQQAAGITVSFKSSAAGPTITRAPQGFTF